MPYLFMFFHFKNKLQKFGFWIVLKQKFKEIYSDPQPCIIQHKNSLHKYKIRFLLSVINLIFNNSEVFKQIAKVIYQYRENFLLPNITFTMFYHN